MHRILVLRPDNIGDCVLSSGALRWIRRHFPLSHIELMVQPHVRNLFELCPHVNEVTTTNRFFPWRSIRKTFQKGTWTLERILRDRRVRPLWHRDYDLIIYPVSAPTEEFLEEVRLLKASEKWGFGGAMLNISAFENEANVPEEVFSRVFTNMEADMWRHELWRTKHFLKSYGVDVEDLAPEFWLSSEDELFAERNMPRGTVLGIFPGAAHSYRQWSVEKWAGLLASQTCAQEVVIFGSEKDRTVAGTILGRMHEARVRFTNLTGRTTLRQLASCIKRCSGMVSTESAGLHIGVAVGIPTVGLMGGHHYGRFYPWGSARIHRAVHAEVECFPCHTECRYTGHRCIRDIPVETVVEQLSVAVREGQSRAGLK